eukprot:gene25994-32511_t
MTLLTKTGALEEIDSLSAENVIDLNQLLDLIGNDPVRREQKLSMLIERCVVPRMLHQFFVTGRVPSQSQMQPCNDDEYIGAVLSLAQEISRYVIGRACENDIGSIDLCRALVTQLQGKMLEFDFRNGPLRRKYDGLKYAVKNIEDISFELSLQSDASPAISEESDERAAKRIKTEGGIVSSDSAVDIHAMSIVSEEEKVVQEVVYFDVAEIDAIRLRMDNYDKLREQVIKDSRDVQKLAKQSIYSVMRGQLGDAKSKLAQAEKCALKIMETINSFPTLRHGAFSNSLEEWAEGKLTLEWAESKRVMTKAELAPINSTEYVGALSDFTGEIGRIAVMQASKRDLESVREIHQVDVVIATAISQVNGGNRYGKKLEAINTNTKKVEDVIYELSMLQRSGRRMRTAVDLAPAAGEKEEKSED